jgi:hypothetical protein
MLSLAYALLLDVADVAPVVVVAVARNFLIRCNNSALIGGGIVAEQVLDAIYLDDVQRPLGVISATSSSTVILSSPRCFITSTPKLQMTLLN